MTKFHQDPAVLFVIGVSVGIFVVVMLLFLNPKALNVDDEKQEPFMNVHRKLKINQPMTYRVDLLNAPFECKPYMGCAWPDVDKRSTKGCKVSWRDCAAYRECNVASGTCVPKKGLDYQY